MKSINHGAHQASRGLNFAKLSPQIFAARLELCRLHLLKISLMSFAMSAILQLYNEKVTATEQNKQ